MNKATKDARLNYKLDADRCQVCSTCMATDVHEIASGAARQAAVSERCAWLAVCRVCHHNLHDYTAWPLEKTLALKLLKDPNWFDLAKINELRGRAPTAPGNRGQGARSVP